MVNSKHGRLYLRLVIGFALLWVWRSQRRHRRGGEQDVCRQLVLHGDLFAGRRLPGWFERQHRAAFPQNSGAARQEPAGDRGDGEGDPGLDVRDPGRPWPDRRQARQPLSLSDLGPRSPDQDVEGRRRLRLRPGRQGGAGRFRRSRNRGAWRRQSALSGIGLLRAGTRLSAGPAGLSGGRLGHAARRDARLAGRGQRRRSVQGRRRHARPLPSDCARRPRDRWRSHSRHDLPGVGRSAIHQSGARTAAERRRDH